MCNTVIPIINDDVPIVPSTCVPISSGIETNTSLICIPECDSLHGVEYASTGDVIIAQSESEIELNEYMGSQVEVNMVSNEVTDNFHPVHIKGSPNSDYVINPGDCPPDKIHLDDPKSALRGVKAKNVDRPVIAHLNINYLESKFEPLKSLIKENVDILLVSETKLDSSFPSEQFVIDGYSKPIRRDRNCHGGGVLFLVRDDLPCRELTSHTLPDNVEGIFIEITIRKSKWLIMGAYCPHKDKISYFLSSVSKELDKFLPSYENILLLGDYNSTMSEKEMHEFCETYNLENLIKGPTCFKNPSNPSSIDVMLTNKKSSFQNSMTLETGLSDCHHMTITVLKRYFKKKILSLSSIEIINYLMVITLDVI